MPSKYKRFPVSLLHIDDNRHDRNLVHEAIRSSKTSFDFHGADTLQAATEHFPLFSRLSRVGRHTCPALVLLDYDVGVHQGTDFLYWLRTMHHNTAVAVIMYSSSIGHDHVGECYANGANYFLRKPESFIRIVAIVHALRSCFSFLTPRFRHLARLLESEPDPRMTELTSLNSENGVR